MSCAQGAAETGSKMAQIHILDSETIDKIAAGEVVERPSSVVKELVENAIDAGATAITVEAKDGGIEFIRVTDNGGGMEKDQLRTAFLRHATSKIEDASDLMRIRSLGFRGEALSSIAAVSKVEVITKTKESMTGTRILLEGAREIAFEEIGAPDGTTFLMRNLFFNTPVRRKFLKQPATEGGYIADLMEHLALSRPDISFKLILGNQMKFHTSGNGDLREVIYRIYGREVANALVPIQKEQEGIRIEGYLGKPVQVRSNRNFEIYFINGRFVRSGVVSRAIEEGYREYLMQHKFPLCVLHITMDTERVDVNVHPTKMDVRFTNAPSFSALLCGSVKYALKSNEMIPDALLTSERELKAQERQEKLERESSKTPEPFEEKRRDSYRVMEEMRYEANRTKMREFVQNPVWKRVKGNTEPEQPVLQAEEPFFTESQDKTLESGAAEKKLSAEGQEKVLESRKEEESFFTECQDKTLESRATEKTLSVEGQEKVLESGTVEEPASVSQPEISDVVQMNLFEERILSEENRRKYRFIGQVFETYWLIEFEDKLLMIDQHAAHEKVNYEHLMKQYREKNVVSQRLLPPIVLSLSGQEQSVLEENLEVFTDLGFEVEEFGGSEYALRSVPVDLYGCQEKQMFLEVLDQLSEGGNFGSIRVIEEKIASMSCKAAVKGNNYLSQPEAEKLIDELLTLDNPYNCPHGRPTIITMSKQEMDKKFKRIVG